MIYTISSVLSCSIAVAAFLYGAVKILVIKEKPLYFKLIIGAVGCYMLEELCSFSFFICFADKEVESVPVTELAIFGSVIFLLSANYGQMDEVVDEGNISKKIKRIACIAPLVLLLSTVALNLLVFRDSLLVIICGSIILIAMVPAGYLNMKHLVMPVDALEFLNATRACNVCALLYYATTHLYQYSILTGSPLIQSIVGMLVTLTILALSISAVRGCEKWPTLT